MFRLSKRIYYVGWTKKVVAGHTFQFIVNEADGRSRCTASRAHYSGGLMICWIEFGVYDGDTPAAAKKAAFAAMKAYRPAAA